MTFVAGQFISVREPRAENKFVTRAYSIASAPRGNNTFDLCLNRVDEGFMSNFLCSLEVGETAHFHGPHGLFVLKPEVEDVIMVATGTGVAPFRSMARDLFGLDRRRPAPPQRTPDLAGLWHPLPGGHLLPRGVRAAWRPRSPIFTTSHPEPPAGELDAANGDMCRSTCARSWADARTCTSISADSTRWFRPCASCCWRNAAGTNSRVIYERYD